eukprot:GHVS01005292.1.p1 GENE.GHVS01005292.1~~GHVS01005292.1.p1  ORF type:complete len:469 (+),score=63.42 GHVS01005292.1:57-1463(+)
MCCEMTSDSCSSILELVWPYVSLVDVFSLSLFTINKQTFAYFSSPPLWHTINLSAYEVEHFTTTATTTTVSNSQSTINTTNTQQQLSTNPTEITTCCSSICLSSPSPLISFPAIPVLFRLLCHDSSLTCHGQSVHSITVQFSSSIHNKHMIYIPTHNNLAVLRLNACHSITNDGLVIIGNRCRYLRTIELYWNIQITDQCSGGLCDLVVANKHIKHINLAGCKQIGDQSLKALVGYSAGTIRHNNNSDGVGCCDICSDEDEKERHQWGGQSEQQIYATNIKREEDEEYSKKTAVMLRYCNLTRCLGLTDVAICLLCECAPLLESLYLYACNQLKGSTAFMQLHKLRNLTNLDLCGTDIQDVQMVKWLQSGGAWRLERLNLSWCLKITDLSLSALGQNSTENSKLRWLSLHGNTNITPTGFDVLGKCAWATNIECLDIRGCSGLKQYMANNNKELLKLFPSVHTFILHT